ncbi:hypothetical protein [Bdellovibrio sp. NC01]|uniref:hypothetical protein n=1 Tax=Bdellovibrio sp. NC01 TaxID=2220073 RepID=UPI001157333D|nr:hypothetical protein [Bdellovibrio sp. NC01]QDK38624.1 hypothetical protein DOE51_14055 [Bdellovibrio sp. NC01]
MKTLISKITMITSLLGAMTLLPSLGHASEMRLQNQTIYLSTFVIYKGDILVAHIQIPPSGLGVVRTDSPFQVQALTKRGGQTLNSQTLNLDRPKNFDAVITESGSTLSFDIVDSAPSYLDAVAFNNTTASPVQFMIKHEGAPAQSFIVNGNDSKILSIDETFRIYAIINGVTTAVYKTTNPNAVANAVVISQQDFDYYDLVIE